MTTQQFDIHTHIDQRLGPLTLFPSDQEDWPHFPRSRWIAHLQEVRVYVGAVDQAARSIPQRTTHPGVRMVGNLVANLSPTAKKRFKEDAVKWLKVVDDLIAELDGIPASAAPRTEPVLAEKISVLD